MMEGIGEPLDEFRNGGGLVAGWDEVGAQGEGAPRGGGKLRRGFSRWIHPASIGGSAQGSWHARYLVAGRSRRSAPPRFPSSLRE